MSRFFATASDSESDTELYEEEIQTTKTQPRHENYPSDDEEETKRVVKTAREKRYHEMTEHIRLIRNHRKIKDFAKMLSEFEALAASYVKSRPVIDKEEGIGKVPSFYLRILMEIEDFITDCWEDREGRKALSKNNSKCLSTLRQRIKKYNKDFETELVAFRENPVDDEAEEKAAEPAESDEESEDDEPAVVAKVTKTAAPRQTSQGGGEDSDDSEMWDNDSDDESSSSGDEKYGDNLASKFLKKSTDKDDNEKERRRKEKKDKRARPRFEEGDDDEEEEGWEVVRDGAVIPTEKPKMFAKDAEINHQSVLKKLNEIIAARGKKGTDRHEQISLLSELLSIADQNELGPAFQIKIMFSIISALFDYNLKTSPCMKPENWHKTLSYINQCLDDLFKNAETLSVGENVMEENESLEEAPYKVKGCILTVVEKMDEEFTKILQNADAHSPEYIERLKDEVAVVAIIDRLQDYLEKKGTPGELCRVYLRSIDHLYYKFDAQVLSNEPGNSAEKMSRLCKYIYAQDSTDRIRTQTILCAIYHSALHDRWFEARDLMLMSHLQDTIGYADVATQIMYNRALVQLGLCAFRHGNVKDAHHALLDIQSGGRAKEMLAQGLLPQRQQERTSEQEKIEKRRQQPFHKHINLELFECVYLVSAMLIEIPAIVFHELDGRKRMISKSFHYQLRNTERQPLVGPPESMREHVVAASKAMRVGNWKACRDYVINEKMNAKVWDLFHQADKVRSMIESKIKEESLRTYLFMYSCVYDSLSLHTLALQFELEYKTVHSFISKMIINGELQASIDEPNQMIVLHRAEPSRIQALALQLSDKVTNLMEHNEKLWDIKQGGYPSRNMNQNYRGDREQRGDGYREKRDNYRNRGGDNNNEDGGKGNWQERKNRRGGNRDNYRGDRDNNRGNRHNNYQQRRQRVDQGAY